jgi:hypothetical protein
LKTYRPGSVPTNPAELPGFLMRELQAIHEASHRPAQFAELETLHAEPARLREGMVVLADGTDWDPGFGAGFYGYYGAAWVKLG